jgi:conjugal transfer pilus assembly protein TrbC
MKRCFIFAAAALFLTAHSAAQKTSGTAAFTPPSLSGPDFDAAMQKGQQARQETLRRMMEQEGQLQQPKLDPLAGPVPMPRAGQSLKSPEQIADEYRRLVGSGQIGRREDEVSDTYVFVSLSIPAETLKHIAAQAKRVGAIVVFRGLRYGIQNYLRSMEAFAPLRSVGAAYQIHPELFRVFDVRAVPTVVVAPGMQPGCQEGLCRAGAAAVSGDVSLDYALEHLARRNDAAGRLAQHKLKLLQAPASR